MEKMRIVVIVPDFEHSGDFNEAIDGLCKCGVARSAMDFEEDIDDEIGIIRAVVPLSEETMKKVRETLGGGFYSTRFFKVKA